MSGSSLFKWFQGWFSSQDRELSEGPVLEALESRIAPAVIATVSHGTLKITGDELGNDIVITGDASDPTKFTISSTTDTINGLNDELVVTGVKNISIKFKAGDDKVTFEGSAPVTLDGNLSIDGGTGNNWVAAEKLSVAGDFLLNAYEGQKRGANIGGTFTDLHVAGAMKFLTGGGTGLTVNASETGHSEIGSFSARTMIPFGGDFIFLDTTIHKDFVFKGKSYSTIVLGNDENSSFVGGNLTASWKGMLFLDGVVAGDAKLAFKYGGAFYSSGVGDSPSEIRGDLFITQKQFPTLQIYVAPEAGDAGLKIGGNLVVTTAKATDFYKAGDTLDIKHLQVVGSSKISLGDGRNTVTLSDSTFGGSFSLKGGKDQDKFLIDSESIVFGVAPVIDPGWQPTKD